VTQRELARAAGINKATISSYERGRQPIGPENLSALLDALEVPLRAWSETLGHVDRLHWLTSRRHLLEERPDELQGLQRHVDALAMTVGHGRERQAADLLDLAVDLLGALDELRDRLAREQG
jgi:transcriptional regulator with XRE-family HTH domain